MGELAGEYVRTYCSCHIRQLHVSISAYLWDIRVDRPRSSAVVIVPVLRTTVVLILYECKLCTATVH